MLWPTVLCACLGLAVATPDNLKSNGGLVNVLDATNTGSPRRAVQGSAYEEGIRTHGRAVRETEAEKIINNEGSAFGTDQTYDNATINNNGAVYNAKAVYNNAKVVNWGAVYVKDVVYNHANVTNLSAVYNGPVTYNCSTATDDDGTVYVVPPVKKCDQK